MSSNDRLTLWLFKDRFSRCGGVGGVALGVGVVVCPLQSRNTIQRSEVLMCDACGKHHPAVLAIGAAHQGNKAPTHAPFW